MTSDNIKANNPKEDNAMKRFDPGFLRIYTPEKLLFACLIVPAVFFGSIYVIYAVKGDLQFNLLFKKIYFLLCLVLPFVSARICYQNISENKTDSNSPNIIASIITYIDTLVFCILLSNSDYSEFIYDLLPFDGFGCDVAFYFVIGFVLMLPVTLLPLFLRIIVNDANYRKDSDVRKDATSLTMAICVGLSYMVVIGREIVTEPNIINVLLAVFILSVMQVFPILISIGLYKLLCI